jgi:hypothetical protein
MKRIIPILALVILAGCRMPYETELIPDLGLETLEDVLHYVADHTSYVPDEDAHGRIDEWQEPHQTYIWGTGDCEDHAILVVYLADRLGIEIKAEMGYAPEGGHMWVSVDGNHYESVMGWQDNELPDRFDSWRHTYNADEVLSASIRRAVQ